MGTLFTAEKASIDMAAYKFISTWRTDKECYIRRLFGNNGKVIEKTGEQLDVKQGDLVFLHRLEHNSLGELDGPFIAASDAQSEIQPYAWRHVGHFSWQVEIDWEERIYSMNIEKINSQSEDPPVEIKVHPQKFNDVQGTYLAGLIKREGTSIINSTGVNQ